MHGTKWPDTDVEDNCSALILKTESAIHICVYCRTDSCMCFAANACTAVEAWTRSSCETSITMVLHSYHDCVLCIKSCSLAKLLTFQPFSSLSDCLCFWPHRNVLKFSNHSSYFLKTVFSNPIKMRTVLCLFYSTVEFEANSKWTCVNFSNLSISPNLTHVLD